MLTEPIQFQGWLLILQDPTPLDLAISGLFLVAILSTLAAAVAERSWARRSTWVIVAGLLTGLLVNQQLDLHRWVLDGAARLITGDRRATVSGLFGSVEWEAVMLIAAAVGLVGLALALVRPREALVGFGLALLAVHGLLRAGTFVDLLDDTMGAGTIPLGVKAIEIAGLCLIVVGALGWLRPRRDADRSPATRDRAVSVG